MFDKKLCMENIYFLAKEKGIKIGDLEKVAGLSTGYLSKLSKEGNTAVPGIDSLLEIASTLYVSIDALVSIDFKVLNSNEKYFAAFIEKLIRGTDSGKVTWEIEGGAYLNSNDTGENFVHPLFLPTPSAIPDPVSGELVDYVANVYQSRFLRFNSLIHFGNCYHCELGKGGDVLYIMKIYPGDKNYPERSMEEIMEKPEVLHEEIELYIVDRNEIVKPLCSTYSVGEEMGKIIEKLYSKVSGTGNYLNLSSDTKSIIDNFMNLNW